MTFNRTVVICPVHEIDEIDGQVFLVMAYLEGRVLNEKVGDGPLPIDEALHIAIQVADALAEAHEHEIVHRDIKGANIMVSPKGHAFILDFGLAQMKGESRLTKTGTTLGTAGYMSPEQAQGQPVDHRSDIWSLGVVLYEMLTGQLPFRGEYELATMYGIVNERPKPVRELRPELPEPIEGVFDRALAKKPEDRYATAAEFASDLRRVQDPPQHDTVSVATPRPSLPTRPIGFKSWKAVAAALCVILAALAIWKLAPPTIEFVQTLLPQPIPAEKHLAVLPFESLTDDPADRALSDGLAEALAAKLTQLERTENALLVVPLSEIRSRNVGSVMEARRLFGVNMVITGSLRNSGDRLHVIANLVDAPSLRQLGAETLEGAVGDTESLVDELFERTVTLLELESARGSELPERAAAEPSAYAAYLEGRGYLQRFEVAGNVDKAIQSLEEAVHQDPNHALAHAGLGTAYWKKYSSTNDKPWADKAFKSAERSIQLNGRLAPTRVNLGELYWETGRFEEAIGEFRQALQLDPGSSRAHRGPSRKPRVRSGSDRAGG